VGRPTIPEIIIPSRRSLADPNKRCGETWSEWVEVRKPYGNVDSVTFQLEPLDDYSAFESFDEGPGLLESAQNGIDAASEMFSDNRDFIDETNRSALQKILDRAQSYVNAANAIWRFWNDEYRFYSKGGSGWPLGIKLQDFLPGASCWNKSAGQKVTTTSLPADNIARNTKVTWNCPTINITEGHRVDEKNYLKLVKAAMLNARCAQEAVASVAAYYQNKERMPPARHTISAAPKRTVVSGTVVKKTKLIPSGQEPEFEPGGPVVDTQGETVPTDEVPETKPRKKKKKTTGLLIAGGLAVALLALKK